MVIWHIARLDSFQASGVNAVVPEHVKNQRQYADAALWNIGEFFEIDRLDQNFSAGELDDLPEMAFFNVGTIEDAKKKAVEIGGEIQVLQ